MRDGAQTVIVGAGIVGASAAYHLAELGQADVLVIERGPLFETGGSTSHAPGLAFQTNGSRSPRPSPPHRPGRRSPRRPR